MELLQHLVPVYLAYIVATASPGPSNMAIMATAMSRGRLPALVQAAGVITGSMFWASLAATGLSALLASYAHATVVIRIVGGLYLLYLAWRSFKSAVASTLPETSGAQDSKPSDYGVLYRRGLLLHLSNAKAIMAWIAIMSLGVKAGMPVYVLPIMLGGCVVLGVMIFCGYALAFSTPPMVLAYRRARRWIEGAIAIFFGFAGLRLLLSRS